MSKRRKPKARIDLNGELAAWRTMFCHGLCFDGELEPVGIPTEVGRPTEAEVEAAWRRLGRAYITRYGGSLADGRLLFALREYGEPPP